MVDFYIEEYTKFHKTEPDPTTLAVPQATVIAQLKESKDACGPLLEVINDPDLINELRGAQRFTLEHLKGSHGVRLPAPSPRSPLFLTHSVADQSAGLFVFCIDWLAVHMIDRRHCCVRG
jgi:hypothetical protein